MLAQIALANDDAAREQKGPPVFSEAERRFLRRIVEEVEENAPPNPDEFGQLFQLFGRTVERHYVPFPGMPRLLQMQRLIEAASRETRGSALSPAGQEPVDAETAKWRQARRAVMPNDAPFAAEDREMKARHRSRVRVLDHHTRTAAEELRPTAPAPVAPPDMNQGQPPFRRRSRPTLENGRSAVPDAD